MYYNQIHKPRTSIANDRMALAVARQECRNMTPWKAAQSSICQEVARIDHTTKEQLEAKAKKHSKELAKNGKNSSADDTVSNGMRLGQDINRTLRKNRTILLGK